MLGGFPNPIVVNTFIVADVRYETIGADSLKRVECSLLEGSLGVEPYVYLERMGCVRKIIEDFTASFLVVGAVEGWLRCYKDSAFDYQTERFRMTAEEGEDCIFQGLNPTEEAEEDELFSIFPNPLGVLDLHIRSNDDTATFTAELYDGLGRRLWQKQSEGELLINPDDLPAGFYMLRLYHETKQIWQIRILVKQ